jgi:hypothetical protein
VKIEIDWLLLFLLNLLLLLQQDILTGLAVMVRVKIKGHYFI